MITKKKVIPILERIQIILKIKQSLLKKPNKKK